MWTCLSYDYDKNIDIQTINAKTEQIKVVIFWCFTI